MNHDAYFAADDAQHLQTEREADLAWLESKQAAPLTPVLAHPHELRYTRDAWARSAQQARLGAARPT